MPDFIPIDHKDSDPDYRAAVRSGIEDILHSRLSEVADAEVFVGEWQRTCPRLPNRPAQGFTYLADGTFQAPYDREDSPRGRWAFEQGVYTEITWGAPSPEYGILEGTWNPTMYHCAMTEAGEIAIWNGDGSLLLLLTRLPVCVKVQSENR